MNAPAPTRPAEEAVAAVPARRDPVLKWVVRTVGAAGAVVGAWACYGFGIQVSGILLGVVAAINGAIFGALMAGTVADSLVRRFSAAKKA